MLVVVGVEVGAECVGYGALVDDDAGTVASSCDFLR